MKAKLLQWSLCQPLSNTHNNYLHDKEVRVVNIELNRSEQVLHSGFIGIASIDQVLIMTAKDNLKEY